MGQEEARARDKEVLGTLSDQAGGIPQLMVKVQADGSYQVPYVNTAASEVFGLPKIQVGEGLLTWEELPHELAAHLRTCFQGFEKEEEPALPIFEVNNPVRAAYTINVVRQVDTADAGFMYWFVFSFHDVTQWLTLQEEVMNSRRMDSIGALASGVAHDFNNLIMAIQGHAEFIASLAPDQEAIAQSLEQIRKACDSGSALTQSLLGFARRQSLVLEPMHVGSLFLEVVELCRRSYGTRYVIELDPSLSEDLKRLPSRMELGINGCHTALSHCLLNVLNNAKDSMPEKGSIRVENRSSGGRVKIAIIDSGEGIAEENKGKIFEPFFTTKQQGAGTGLGLAMAHGIMKQHQGEIVVESELGKGTTVIFDWPHHVLESAEGLDPQASGRIRTTNSLPEPELPSKEAMLIDDDEIVRSSVGRLLQINKMEVRDYPAAEQALEDLKNGARPGLIMVDYTMPGMDGISFIRAAYEVFRKLPNPPYIKIVLISGHPPEYFEDFLKEFDGAPIYLLHKPFTAQQIQEVMLYKPQRFIRRMTSRVRISPHKLTRTP